MNESGFQIFNTAFSVTADVMYAACLGLFLRGFIMEHGYLLQKCVFVFFTYLFVSWLCGWLGAPQGTFPLVLILLLTAGAKFLALERPMAFLLGLLYWETKSSSALAVESLYFIADRILPYKTKPPEAVYLRTSASLTVLLLSHAILFSMMLYALWLRVKKQALVLHRLEICYVSLIPAAGILFGQLIAVMLYEVKDGEMLQLYERHPVFLAIVPLVAVLFYAGTYLTILFQQKMAALRGEQEAYFVEHQQTQAIRARIHEAEQFYSRIRWLKHEMRGHLTNIKGLVQSKEYESLETYISRMDGSIRDFELTLQTGNPVTDVIVNDKRRQCLELGIRFQVDFHYPGPELYDAFDLGIVLQNLLQNALEACEKVSVDERFISLAGKQKGRFFLIEVKNSFAGDIAFGQNGLPATAKKTDAPMHGIGLSNVQRIAEKYMGEMDMNIENQIFDITVMVQERRKTQ